jgi:hypothetical protein
MPDPVPDQTARWHREFAAALFNHAWTLLEKPDRTSAEDDDMLAAAFASRFHWGRVGTAREWAFGDEHIARVCSALGHGDLAVRYATQALATTEAEGWQDFALAAAHESVARASAAAGDRQARDRHLALGRAALDLIDDPDDRAVIETQLDDVP